jgi:hypothetical protein
LLAALLFCSIIPVVLNHGALIFMPAPRFLLPSAVNELELLTSPAPPAELLVEQITVPYDAIAQKPTLPKPAPLPYRPSRPS